MVHSEVCGVARTLAALSRAGLDAAVVRTYSGPPGPLLAAREPAREREEIAVLRAVRMLKTPLPGTG